MEAVLVGIASAGNEGLFVSSILSRPARQRGYFSPGAIGGLFARHQADSIPHYGDLLWRVPMLELWHRRHVDGATVG